MKNVNHQQLKKLSRISAQDQWSQQESQFSNQSQEYSFGQFLKKEKLRKRKQKIQYFKKVKSNGFWTIEENKHYLDFLKKNKLSFVDQKSKRSNRIFRKMSNQIKTRSSLQCRSHHQKFEASYPNVDELIRGLSQKLLNGSSDSQKEKYTKSSQLDGMDNQKRAQIRPINQIDNFRSLSFNRSDLDQEIIPQAFKVKIQIISSFIQQYC